MIGQRPQLCEAQIRDLTVATLQLPQTLDEVPPEVQVFRYKDVFNNYKRWYNCLANYEHARTL
jgi:hypothetical protein